MYNIVYIDEVVKALVLLDKSNSSSGEIYIVNNFISYRDMDTLIKNVDPIVTKKTQTIIFPIGYILAVVLQCIYFLLRKKSPLTFLRLRVFNK